MMQGLQGRPGAIVPDPWTTTMSLDGGLRRHGGGEDEREGQG
jgi:hypothetical protein